MSCVDVILCAIPQSLDSSASSFESCHHRRTAMKCKVSRPLANKVVPLQDKKSYEGGSGGVAPPVGVTCSVELHGKCTTLKHFSSSLVVNSTRLLVKKANSVEFCCVLLLLLGYLLSELSYSFLYINSNKMHMLQSLFLSDNCSTCFGRHYHPSSGVQNNCNYSIW